MKRLSLLLIVVVALIGMSACATAGSQERRAQVAAQVEQALTERHYTIDIDMMYPLRGRAVNVTSNYSLEIRNDSLISYLPYFGRAYHLPYGGGKGLNFSAPLQRYEAVRAKKDMTRILLEAVNDEDYYQYQIEVFDNGNATVYLRSREREAISYSGKMDLENTK